MQMSIPAEARPLLQPARLYAWSDLAADRTLVPARSGVYAWYFDEIPAGVSVEECVVFQGSTLLYVGIAPKEPPKNGRSPSSATLRSRLRQHYRLNAAGSTLRLTLGCLLGLELRRVGSGNRMTFTALGEKHLSDWMAAHGRVCWVETPAPWVLEHATIPVVSLPLNLDQNRNHGFHARLSELRARAKARARELPIVAT